MGIFVHRENNKSSTFSFLRFIDQYFFIAVILFKHNSIFCKRRTILKRIDGFKNAKDAMEISCSFL